LRWDLASGFRLRQRSERLYEVIMSQSPNTMNFLPEDYVEKRQAARTAVVFVGLILVVVAGTLATFLWKRWQSEAIFVEQAKVVAQFEEAEKKIAEANEIDRQKATMLAKAELATTLMERVPRNILLQQLTEMQPASVHMVNLELTTKEIKEAGTGAAASDLEKAKRQQEGLPPEAAKPPVREVTVNLISVAQSDADVAKYIAALSKSPLLSDVNLLFSEEFKVGVKENEKKSIRKFHVEMRIAPHADLRQIDGASASL
jgi:hypothetical protein